MISSKKYARFLWIWALAVLLLFPPVSSAAPLDALYPPDGARDVAPGTVNLLWEEVPLDEHITRVSYEVSFGESASSMDFKPVPKPGVAAFDVETAPGTSYLWQVRATKTSEDKEKKQTLVEKSKVYSFTTFLTVPTLMVKYPADSAIGVPYGEITLQWYCDDPNLRFDVYFGHNAESLKLFRRDLRKPLCDVLVEDDRKYFWQIETTDSRGVRLLSPIWSFTTKADSSLGGGCLVSPSPAALLLGAPLLLLFRKL